MWCQKVFHSGCCGWQHNYYSQQRQAGLDNEQSTSLRCLWLYYINILGNTFTLKLATALTQRLLHYLGCLVITTSWVSMIFSVEFHTFDTHTA